MGELKEGYVATVEQIAQWKAKHTNIFLVTVEGHTCYLRAPGRKELSYAASIGTKDPMKFNEAILNNCWLDGDEEIKTNDRLFMGVAAKLEGIIEIAEADLKKL